MEPIFSNQKNKNLGAKWDREFLVYPLPSFKNSRAGTQSSLSEGKVGHVLQQPACAAEGVARLTHSTATPPEGGNL